MATDVRSGNGNNEDRRPAASPAEDRLTGWKSIASYLGRDIRTVQRWEQTEHLPIHRLEHQSARQGSAYAFRSEIDDWQKRRSTDPMAETTQVESAKTPRRWVWSVIGLAAAVAALAIVALLLNTRSRSRGAAAGADTDNAQAYAAYAEGKAFYTARQYKPAVASLETAVRRDAGFGSAWALLAKAHARLAQPVWAGGKKETDHADESARRAASLAPNSPDTRIALALAARARGDVATWRSEAQRAIGLDPRAGEAYALLGDSYASVIYACNRDQDPERAEAYYRKALELTPDLMPAISNRAGNLRRMGRYTECIELLDKAVQSFRDEPPLRATRGGCRLMQGDIKGATEDIDFLRGNPRFAPAGALVYLGFLDLKKGDTEKGVAELEDAVKASPSSRSDLIVAEVFAIVGDVPRATSHMKHAFASDPTCAGMVDTSLAFRTVRHKPEVTKLLREYGIQ